MSKLNVQEKVLPIAFLLLFFEMQKVLFVFIVFFLRESMKTFFGTMFFF